MKILQFLSQQRVLWVIIGAGVVLRGLMLSWYLASHGGQGETWEYEVVARNLLAGDGLSFPYLGSIYRSYYVPVFPAICAALHWIGGPGLGLYYATQLAVSAAIIFLVYRIADALFGRYSGLLAAVISAVEPGLIIYQSYKVDVAPIATLLLLIATDAFLRMRGGQPSSVIISGLATGTGIMVRPDVAAFLAAPLVWTIWGRFSAIRSLLLLLTAAALPILPWAARNYMLHHRVILTSSLTGQLLWTGNNPNSTGTLWTVDGRPQISAAPDELRARLRGAGELSNLDTYQAEAWGYISAASAEFLMRSLRKVWYFWWFPPDYSGRKYYGWVPGPLILGYRLLWICLMALAVFGSWKIREAETVLILWAAPVALSVIHGFYYVEGRHRLLILPLIIVLASRGLTEILSDEHA